MKNQTLLITAIAVALSGSCLAQQHGTKNPILVPRPKVERPVGNTDSIPKKEYIEVDIVQTYERVMGKGYKSDAMIKKVADRHFFNGDLVLAAQWYTELFDCLPSELEAVYYYRYAQSLKAVNQPEKATEMMKLFESKSL